MTLNCIAVDDEPLALNLVCKFIEETPFLNLVGQYPSAVEALRAIHAQKIDLLYLDIQMPDLTGFEVLEKLEHKPNIIFTTAYEQYAIRAFETFSIDYLLKPVREERLEQAIRKLRQFTRVETPVDVNSLQQMIQQLRAPQKATALPIRTGDKIVLVRFENIAYLEAQDKYVFVYTWDGHKHLTDQTLTSLAEKLPPPFLRIHKSYIINKERIREMHRHFSSRYLFIMDDKAGTRLTSGRTYYEPIRSEFGL